MKVITGKAAKKAKAREADFSVPICPAQKARVSARCWVSLALILGAAFYGWLGPKKRRKIRLAVMDMWKPFRDVTKDNAPQAAVLFDKFHIMRHLGEALDKVRKAEYARL